MPQEKPISPHDVRGALAKVKLLIPLIEDPEAIPETQRTEILESAKDAVRVLEKALKLST